ncbi:MAG: hypothetical protein JNM17_09725 [Archangium sp.]|nr:hypothetical protein [Archangium sp.]
MAEVEGWIDWVSAPREERGWVLGFFLAPWRGTGETKWRKGKLVVLAPVPSVAAGRRLAKKLKEGGSYRMRVREISHGRMRATTRPKLVDDVPEPR